MMVYIYIYQLWRIEDMYINEAYMLEYIYLGIAV